MRRALLVALLIAGATPPARGQSARGQSAPGAAAALHGDRGGVCGADWQGEATWESLRRFDQARRSGELAALRAARKTAASPAIGERRVFNVLEDLWTSREFELRDTTRLYHLWVATANLPDVTDDEIAGLREAMMIRTPPGSFDPDRGILANNREIFGEMPDYDGDGILDILLYDMKAGDGATTRILGYTTAVDVQLGAAEGSGNQRDVLYLDAVEGSRNLTTLASVASHELTHLIHFNYLGTRREDTFIMEGLAEYSMVKNGYRFRTAAYLDDPRELALPILGWRDGGGPNAFDYQRASLFFSYAGERVGPLAVGAVLRGPGEGGLQSVGGLDAVLKANGSSFASVVAGFHTANRFNDPGLDASFGYVEAARIGIPTRPTRTFAEGIQAAGTLRLDGGAVEYFAFERVDLFEFSMDTPTTVPELQAQLRARIRGRVVMETFDGARHWEDLVPAGEPYWFQGPFRRIDLVLANVTGTVRLETEFVYDARWVPAPAGTGIATDDPPPDGFSLGAAWPNPTTGEVTVPVRMDVSGRARVAVFDLLGREIAVPLDAHLPAGVSFVAVRLRDLAPGTYWIVLESGGRRSASAVTRR